jgi:hypothetical protein
MATRPATLFKNGFKLFKIGQRVCGSTSASARKENLFSRTGFWSYGRNRLRISRKIVGLPGVIGRRGNRNIATSQHRSIAASQHRPSIRRPKTFPAQQQQHRHPNQRHPASASFLKSLAGHRRRQRAGEARRGGCGGAVPALRRQAALLINIENYMLIICYNSVGVAAASGTLRGAAAFRRRCCGGGSNVRHALRRRCGAACAALPVR